MFMNGYCWAFVQRMGEKVWEESGLSFKGQINHLEGRKEYINRINLYVHTNTYLLKTVFWSNQTRE